MSPVPSPMPAASDGSKVPPAQSNTVLINPLGIKRPPGGTPYNTPADQPPKLLKDKDKTFLMPRHPDSRRMPSARGKGIVPAHAQAHTHAHAITPGNTPNSLEKISRRIASNLLGEKPSFQGRIAPSYERRFAAGLQDVNHRLAAHEMLGSLPANQAPAVPDVKEKTEWLEVVDHEEVGGVGEEKENQNKDPAQETEGGYRSPIALAEQKRQEV